MNESSPPVLSVLETRVLGVLAEKQHTVPDTYPLTLNALVAGCNQKSSRNPIMNVSQIEVQAAIDSLKHMLFVIESSGGRAARFAHNIERVLKIPLQSVALVTMLMLRGPQTAGELRINSERMHKFADISSVEAFLDELAERVPDSLVVKLPRQPGSRENRWAHLLAGKPEINEHEHVPIAEKYNLTENTISEHDFIALKSDVARLEAEVVALRRIVEELSSQPVSRQNGK
ncbi:hypothetical protein SAMN05216302_100880 [Nitrosomonas aestuarii]|uniref:Uncharacterized protein n=1 Tax=Nitrosomonas aestuarii TaxID=52441 RepID=A0A1I4A924_9PROT|nr:YceH family protein [Nitrosomonas aestuarii]SFK52824.1 hypothetical protein SAMN05216302_100880 [Nitrosomonas aestuarii]